MLNNFANAINDSFANENVLTENGAVAYKTSGKNIVDFNFKMSSYRNLTKSEIVNDFIGVYNENPLLAVKMIFFAGDIRGGMGERRVFNTCMDWLANTHGDIVNHIIHLIPEYNRWDAVINLFFVENTKEKALEIISQTIKSDMNLMKIKNNISLLAKWMPSINTSSKETVKKAQLLAQALNLSFKEYRKTLSALRKYLDVVEVNMCANNWSKIKYESVPSKANLLYKEAFMKRDRERRIKYLDSLENGETKINSSVAFPYDIIHKYSENANYIYKRDIALEKMWESLPDYVNGNGSDTICVVDGSGSMGSTVGNTNISCHDVARSLGIYFAERMKGAFHNQFITFSTNPKLIKFKDNWSLYEKYNECVRHDEVSNTDIQKVFDLILTTAINHNLKQDELPRNILILSDMEFDYCVTYRNSYRYNTNRFNTGLTTLFENICKDYESHGYKMPRLIFWNICSRTNAIPIKENENGVALVSGFSPTIASMVFSNKLDPYEILLEKLNSSRYEPVEKAINSLF